jgi:aspartate/methionine/tyrosine aminotransferase
LKHICVYDKESAYTEKGDDPMKIHYFKMERAQSRWENVVDFNLSESGVDPIAFDELVPEEEIKEIVKTKLGYLQTDGTSQLKEKICGIYKDTFEKNVLVTTGSAEANYLLTWSIIEPGDEAIFMLPNYMQIAGLMRSFGANVKTFHLKEDLGWDPDPDELNSLVTKNTKVISITNPNNPTGGQLSKDAREMIIDLAERADAWLFVDEVYQGAELDETITPSFWGTYKKAVVTCGLSKAYGLPGLRVGWVVAPEDLIEKVWAYKDYTSICLSAVSDRLAQIALRPEKRKKILQRTRRILKTNLPVLESWLNRQEGIFHCLSPKAGAIAFARYRLDINSTELVERLRDRKSVLLCPGDHFEMDGYVRFGYGEKKEYMLQALELVQEGIHELKINRKM